jgi:hypothetical protein
VLAWRMSTSLDASFCLDALEIALACAWKAGDIQYRPGLAVYKRCFHRHAEGQRNTADSSFYNSWRGYPEPTYARHAPRKGAGRSWLWITPKSGEFGTAKKTANRILARSCAKRLIRLIISIFQGPLPSSVRLHSLF